MSNINANLRGNKILDSSRSLSSSSYDEASSPGDQKSITPSRSPQQEEGAEIDVAMII